MGRLPFAEQVAGWEFRQTYADAMANSGGLARLRGAAFVDSWIAASKSPFSMPPARGAPRLISALEQSQFFRHRSERCGPATIPSPFGAAAA